MNNLNILSRWFTTHKKTQFSINDLETVLDFLPNPTLVVDWDHLSIILANAQATELTAYMRTELEGQKLEKFLSCQDNDLPLREALQLSSSYTPYNNFQITTRSGSKIRAIVTGIVESKLNWILFSLETEKQRDKRQSDEQRNQILWNSLDQIIKIIQSDDLDLSLKTILKTACQITNADTAVIYQANGESPTLAKIAEWGESGLLPQYASAQDLMNLKETVIWNRRMHPLTSLQIQGREAGLAYLASSPLGQSFARIGMIVLAGRVSPPTILNDILPIITALTSTSLEVITRTQYLQKRNEESKYEIETANKIKNLVEDSLIFLSSDLIITDFNRAAERSLGYSSQEVIHQRIESIIICSEPLIPLLNSSLKDEVHNELTDVFLYRRNGQAFLSRVQIFPCKLKKSSRGVAILFQDLSEKEKIRRENEVLEQRAVLGEVTASFAHEVRNPINNISTGLQLLELNLTQDDPNQENIRRLQQDCNRLTALIKSGLSFARPMEYKMEPIQMVEMLENLTAAWRYRLERANVQLHLQIDPDLSRVEGDLRAMEQIFTNLINNGVEAMNNNSIENPKILSIKVRQVHVLDGNDQIHVSISDTGSGIPEDIRDRIFEPFFTTKPGGTGIGLAIVKRIITAHKGSINVESVPGGTVFQVQFPVVKDRILRL
jgi:two-component system, NtrC family, sensor histidine kinase AtoS